MFLKKKSTTLILITLILFAFVPTLRAASEAPQPQWSKTYGAYRANSVVQTADGGYAVAGENATQNFRGYSGYAPLLIKTDYLGELQWGNTYGLEFGVDGDALSVVQTEDLGYALCGADWLLKTDTNGSVQWNKTFEELDLFSAIQASDKGYVIVGYEPTSVGGQEVPVLLKTDQNGNLLWNKTFSPSVIAYATSVVETDNGDYVVAGTWGGDFWLAKTDDNGNLLWNQTYYYVSGRRIGPLTFRSVAVTEDEGYVLSGEDGGSAWLVKTDAEGEEEWNLNYIGGEAYSHFSSAVELYDGGYIAAGYYNSSALLVRTDASGDYLWNATYGEKQSDRAFSVVASSRGGFAVAGSLDNSVWLANFFPEPSALQPEQLIIGVVVVVAAICVSLGLLIYLIKRK